MKQYMWLIIIMLGMINSGCGTFLGKTKQGPLERRALTAAQTGQLLLQIEKIQHLTDTGQVKATKAIAAQLLNDYPEIADFDLTYYTKAEISLAKGKRAHSARYFQKLIDEYPESELYGVTLQRLYRIGESYLGGYMIFAFFHRIPYGYFIKIKGDARGIKIMEDIIEEVGYEDPNGFGVRAAVAAARNLEKRKHHEDAYLKWMELSTVWDKGDIEREALLGMARNKRAAYNIRPKHRRHFYDSSKLKTAKSYYQKLLAQYPEYAQTLHVPQIIQDIDEQMADKELSIGRYYKRTGKPRAANLYFTMVVDTWPHTQAAQAAQDLLHGPNSDEP